MCNKLSWPASHRIAQAQQQALCANKATLDLPHTGQLKHNTTGYGQLWLQQTASHRSAGYTQQQACLPAGGLPCLPTRVAQSKHSRAVMCQRSAADCLLRSAQGTATDYVSASYLGAASHGVSSSTAAGYVPARLPDCLTRVAQNFGNEQNMWLPWSCLCTGPRNTN
jgi:hypothetical protein